MFTSSCGSSVLPHVIVERRSWQVLYMQRVTAADSIRHVLLYQWFPTCDTRTTSGTRRSSRWYASNFHFFTKTWIQSVL